MPRYYLHENTNFVLGSLFNPLEPYSSKPDLKLIQWAEQGSSSPTPSGGDIKLRYYEVINQSQYYNALSIDLALEARFSLLKGKATLNFSRDVRIDDKSFSLIMTVEKTYNKEEKEGSLELGEAGKKVLDRAIKQNAIPFLPILTGTEVVKSITKGSRISVIYNVKCSSTSSKSKLLAHLGAKWSMANASFNFHQEMKSLDSAASLTVEVTHIGANLVDGKISEIIKNPSNIENIRMILVEELRKSTYEHAKILSADTIYLHENIADLVFPEQDVSKGKEIVDAYKEAIDKINLCDTLNLQLFPYLLSVEQYLALANQLKNNQFIGMKRDAHENIDRYIGVLESKKNAIKTIYDTSIKSSSRDFVSLINTTTELSIPRIKLDDYLLMPQITFVRWNNDHEIIVNRQGNSEFFDFHATTSVVLAIRNLSLIKFAEIYRDGRMYISFNSEQLSEFHNNQGDTYKIWNMKYSVLNRYGYGWECHYCPSIKHEIRTRLQPEYESKSQYSLRIYLIDGSEITINLGNLKNPAKNYAEVLKRTLDNSVGLNPFEKSLLGIWPENTPEPPSKRPAKGIE